MLKGFAVEGWEGRRDLGCRRGAGEIEGEADVAERRVEVEDDRGGAGFAGQGRGEVGGDGGLADAAGRYVINLPQGGRYYIGSRSEYGDTPGYGEWYGRYEGTPDHSVRLETGKILENIDLVVEQILR